jgi:VanZ family protein
MLPPINSRTTLRYERWWRMGGYVLILYIIYLSLTPRPPDIDMQNGDKLGHFLSYGSLMFWFAQLVLARVERLRWAIGFVLLGVTLEFLQGMTDYRNFDLADILANTVGVLLGWVLALWPQTHIFGRLEGLFARRRSS